MLFGRAFEQALAAPFLLPGSGTAFVCLSSGSAHKHLDAVDRRMTPGRAPEQGLQLLMRFVQDDRSVSVDPRLSSRFSSLEL